jgi:hypothetical protein
LNLAAKFKDAQRLIKEGRAKDACGVLRPILEAYLKKLCAEKNVSPPNTNLGNLIYVLYDAHAINDIERGKFLTWKNFGNAGSHAGTEDIQPRDAEYFLSSLADAVGVELDQEIDSVSNFSNNRQNPSERVYAADIQFHRQAPLPNREEFGGDEVTTLSLLRRMSSEAFVYFFLPLWNDPEIATDSLIRNCPRHHEWTENSKRSRASVSRRIFRENREKEALELIVSQNLEQNLIQMASRYLKECF